MRARRWLGPCVAVAFSGMCCLHIAQAHGAAPAPAVERDGTVHVPAMDVPFSSYASPELRNAFLARTFDQKYPELSGPLTAPRVMEKLRRDLDDQLFNPVLERMKTRYPVRIETATIGGVRTEIITPTQGITTRNRARVLIALHGGSFFSGGGAGARVEAIPIASTGRIKVIAVDYRMWPEHRFPAASEDVAAVYKVLLKDHKPESIGIFGCSAGGMLAAESVAWFQAHDLPRPGAIGIFCASAGNDFNPSGDSRYIAAVLNGYPPPPPFAESEKMLAQMPGYFEGANLRDPLVAPIHTPGVLARFPPTLLLTGTRAPEMSAAIDTHNQLVKLGVEAQLHLWDGAGHAFWSFPMLPEMQEAYDVTVKFFDKQLAQ